MHEPQDITPEFLRDNTFTDFGAIEADIDAMREFATKLQTTVQQNYVADMERISTGMMTEVSASPAFYELHSFFTAHREVMDVTHTNVYAFGEGTDAFAGAAKDISRKYSGSDAFSKAQVGDVQDELGMVSNDLNTLGGEASS